MTRAPRVIVLIPTLNEAQHIEQTIRQLIAPDRFPDDAIMIIADGGSTDGTQGIIDGLTQEFANLRLINNPGKTQAAAMNMLLSDKFAQTQIIIRADAHADYPAGFVADVTAALASKDAASVVIPMDAIAQPDACFQQGLAWVADTKLGAGGSPHRGGTASGYVDHGHHAGFRADVFRALGGYDTGFIANEDAEYDRRVTDAGHKIWLGADLRIGYYPRQSARALWLQYFRYGIGRAQTCRKHGIIPKPRQMIPVAHVLLTILSMILLPFTPLALLWPGVYLALICAAGLGLAIRHRSACGLAATPALGIMHTSWGLGFLRSVLTKRTR